MIIQKIRAWIKNFMRGFDWRALKNIVIQETVLTMVTVCLTIALTSFMGI